VSEIDTKEIAKQVVQEFHNSGICPNGMDAATVASLKSIMPELVEFSRILRGCKATVRAGIISILLIGIVVVFVTGAWHQIKQLLGR
jgi:hypothetical protein